MQKIKNLSESKNFFSEVFQITSGFVLVKENWGVRCTLSTCVLYLLSLCYFCTWCQVFDVTWQLMKADFKATCIICCREGKILQNCGHTV